MQKSFIVGFRLGSKYTSAFYIFLTKQFSSFYTSRYFYNTLSRAIFPLFYRLKIIFFYKISSRYYCNSIFNNI